MFSPAPVLFIGFLLALATGVPRASLGPAPLSAQASAGTPSTMSGEGIFLRVTLHNGTTHFGRADSNPGSAARAGSGAASVAGAARSAGAPPEDNNLMRLVLPDGGVVELPRSSIAREEVVRGRFMDGEFWPSDPNASRLFFAATGRSLPAGTGTFNAYYGLIPFVGVGLTDQVSIAGGTPLFFAGGEGEGRLFYVAPKLQVLRAERVQVATGVLALHQTGRYGESTFLAFGVATLGATSDEGISAGVAWGHEGGEWSSAPTIMLGGDHRTSRRVKLVSENYWFGGDSSGLASLGVRVLGERLAADLALVAPIGSGTTFVFPMVNFSVGW